MDTYATVVLAELQQIHKGDPFLHCLNTSPEHLLPKCSRLLERAQREMEAFPRKDANEYWLRLFVDSSIAAAVDVLRTADPMLTRIIRAVRLLDIALIKVADSGREHLIHKLLDVIAVEAARLELVPKPKFSSSCPISDSDDLALEDSVPEPTILRPIAKMSCPSLKTFEEYMTTTKAPLILADVMGAWEALGKWESKAFWLNAAMGGRRLVPIELGKSYTDGNFGQQVVEFKDFLDRCVHGASAAQREEAVRKGGYTPTAPEQDGPSILEAQTAYLAQFDLFRHVPSLYKDVVIPDYCWLDPPHPDPGTPVAMRKLREGCTDEPSQVHTNIWFGPAWTISSLHHDPYHNILCQVVGKKYIRLYSPHDSDKLYPKSSKALAPHLFGNVEVGAVLANEHLQHLATNEELCGFRSPEEGCSAFPQESRIKVAGEETARLRNLLRQVQEDRLTAFPPESEARRIWAELIKDHTIDESNTSQVDLADVELSPEKILEWPGLSELPYVECILEPGQALYIPVGWWHYVRSCSVAISVNFWWEAVGSA